MRMGSRHPALSSHLLWLSPLRVFLVTAPDPLSALRDSDSPVKSPGGEAVAVCLVTAGLLGSCFFRNGFIV